MTANTKGTILVKSDRIVDRIRKYTEYTLKLEKVKEQGYIDKETFNEYVKSVELIVRTELTEKGATRKWNKILQIFKKS